MEIKNILIVCTGNTCRSPIAEGVLKSLLSSRSNIKVTSAGVFAIHGGGAAEFSIEVCQENGIDISGHSTQPVSRQVVEETDLILTMEVGHRDYLLQRYPAGPAPIYPLLEYADGSSGDIEDPIGCSRQVYERVYRKIEDCLIKALPKLKDRG